jgi:hypothetical protein
VVRIPEALLGGRFAGRSRHRSTHRGAPRCSTRSAINEGTPSDRALGMLDEASQQRESSIA